MVSSQVGEPHTDPFDLSDRLIRYIASTIEAVRDNRHYPRRLRNIKNDIHFCQYKNAL
ncbi:MAG: hypothetical protein H0A76_08045 [Candidatus Thiodubiliella endoseptemdiera]|uniref:Uncharacterized protein n=1 Tax=Candidatus Thiodubiliella endoseptemdiera TaxID=2738886 RepID=A0A853F354_9GAMM|nr:hypothetical protein [Candidatus Thiodubiliella endoseptemdiera]